jgi:hypothetical protein
MLGSTFVCCCGVIIREAAWPKLFAVRGGDLYCEVDYLSLQIQPEE